MIVFCTLLLYAWVAILWVVLHTHEAVVHANVGVFWECDSLYDRWKLFAFAASLPALATLGIVF